MHLIGRRNFLTGLGLGAGSQLLAPIGRGLIGEALGAEGPRKRLILFTAANGLLERYFTCKARSETDFDLTPALSPLAPHKDRLVVAHKFFNPFSKALHGNQMATLTVTESPQKETQMRGPPGGISFDRLIAKKAYATDPISSTALGCVAYRTNATPERALCLSADGLRQPYPAIGSPVLAFKTFFGMGGGAPPIGGDDDSLAKTLAKNRGFVDLIAEDIKRMSGRLAGTERAKLDQYLQSLGQVEKTITDLSVAQGSCKTPTPPTLDPKKGAMDETIDPAVLDAHIDVTFAAQRCNLTHVSHISIEGMEGPHVKYSWLGETANHHDDHHASNQPILEKIVTYWMQKVAKVADLLAQAPEGNGTMLDNSLVMFINSCGGSHHAGHAKHPLIMIAGKNVGMRGGRQVTHPEGKYCISDAYAAIANLFLDPKDQVATFGDPGVCKGPLPGLV
jgi:hypothetical protein